MPLSVAFGLELDERRAIGLARALDGEQHAAGQLGCALGIVAAPRCRGRSREDTFQGDVVRHREMGGDEVTTRRHKDDAASRLIGLVQRSLKSRRVIRRAIALGAEGADIKVMRGRCG